MQFYFFLNENKRGTLEQDTEMVNGDKSRNKLDKLTTVTCAQQYLTINSLRRDWMGTIDRSAAVS